MNVKLMVDPSTEGLIKSGVVSLVNVIPELTGPLQGKMTTFCQSEFNEARVS